MSATSSFETYVYLIYEPLSFLSPQSYVTQTKTELSAGLEQRFVFNRLAAKKEKPRANFLLAACVAVRSTKTNLPPRLQIKTGHSGVLCTTVG